MVQMRYAKAGLVDNWLVAKLVGPSRMTQPAHRGKAEAEICLLAVWLPLLGVEKRQPHSRDVSQYACHDDLHETGDKAEDSVGPHSLIRAKAYLKLDPKSVAQCGEADTQMHLSVSRCFLLVGVLGRIPRPTITRLKLTSRRANLLSTRCRSIISMDLCFLSRGYWMRISMNSYINYLNGGLPIWVGFPWMQRHDYVKTRLSSGADVNLVISRTADTQTQW